MKYGMLCVPHRLSISVVSVCGTMAGDLNCVFRRDWKISPTLILVHGVIIQRKGKGEALLAEELGSLYSKSNIFWGFCFVFLREQDARTNTIFKPK
jgi:hypothetical protein